MCSLAELRRTQEVFAVITPKAPTGLTPSPPALLVWAPPADKGIVRGVECACHCWWHLFVFVPRVSSEQSSSVPALLTSGPDRSLY